MAKGAQFRHADAQTDLMYMPDCIITKICLPNFDPLNSTIYSKTAVYRGIHYFSYFCS